MQQRSPLSQRQRIALLRQVLASHRLPLLKRVAALLVLLYAQPISRIVRLTVNDVLRDDAGRVSIRLGEPPSPVPQPFAEVLLRFMDQRPSMSTATNQTSPWLIPGRRVGEPMTPARIRKRLRAADFPTHQARTAALRQLVLEAPAAVIARMLGYHPVHAALVTCQAGTGWSRYAPGGHSHILWVHIKP